MKIFLQYDHKAILESHTAQSAPKILDEIDALADTLKANLSTDVNIPKDVLDSFKLKDSLNQDIWQKDELSPKVRAKLIQVANDFFKDLNLPKEIQIKDIIFTGSLANFNWSKFSDIDLHIVIDFSQLDAEKQFLDDFFWAQKSLWSNEHDVTVFDYPVELYVQDVNADLVATAIYSVLKNKWIKKPKREGFNPDKKAIKAKADKIIYNLKDIRQDYNDHQFQSVVNKTKKLKDAIKKMRNAGLERGGEFSIENLVFKVLRRTPFMDILDAFKANAYDKLMSVSEVVNEAENRFTKGGILLIKSPPLEDGTQRLFITPTNALMPLKRIKTDQTEGQSAQMAVLGNQVLRLSIVDGRLKALGVAWKSEGSLLKNLGLTRRDVVLNNNKTPLHWQTLKSDNIAKVLQTLGNEILSLPNIRWVG